MGNKSGKKTDSKPMSSMPDIPELQAGEGKEYKNCHIFADKNVSRKKYINLSFVAPVF